MRSFRGVDDQRSAICSATSERTLVLRHCRRHQSSTLNPWISPHPSRLISHYIAPPVNFPDPKLIDSSNSSSAGRKIMIYWTTHLLVPTSHGQA
ncbi:hypothetical protein SLEP1_g2043 [Rubroshorea leprosula]|uniref:Uncharacterized protein n=1 Tax=Rubroshorea leprosula TaxID=152421 RepID=A0AAV5HFU9_9ROSI|nr:hypothetical protein SLEP1_g2043 [Rubroshorea leprosula]